MSTENPTPKKQIVPKQTEPVGFLAVWMSIKRFWTNLTSLKDGLDREGTIINIKNNMRMQGANAWTLMCSIMIASLGLDLNSPAVIIGAMLISPLMAPILGVGLAVGINDYNSLRISFKHFGVSIGIALVTSTLYFLITPFGDFTNEIQSRTAPTFLDAAVALFGGIAGIISGSQRDKSNAIPGVAIATALMPPLCVSGFGIANMIKSGLVNEEFSNLQMNNLEICFNSFYLFFLNATLVALATFLIVRLLGFPIRSFKNQQDQRKTHLILAAISILIIIPSFFILKDVLQSVQEQSSVKKAIASAFGENQTLIDDWSIVNRENNPDILAIKVYASSLPKKLSEYNNDLSEKLPNLKIAILPTAEVNLDDFEALNNRIKGIEKLDSLVENLTKQSEEVKSAEIIQLENQLTNMTQDTSLMKAVRAEILSTFGTTVKEAYYFHPSPASTNPPTLIIDWKVRKSLAVQKQLVAFVKTRAKVEEVVFAEE